MKILIEYYESSIKVSFNGFDTNVDQKGSSTSTVCTAWIDHWKLFGKKSQIMFLNFNTKLLTECLKLFKFSRAKLNRLSNVVNYAHAQSYHITVLLIELNLNHDNGDLNVGFCESIWVNLDLRFCFHWIQALLTPSPRWT